MSSYPCQYSNLNYWLYEYAPGSCDLPNNNPGLVDYLGATYSDVNAASWQHQPRLQDQGPLEHNHTPMSPSLHSPVNPCTTVSIGLENVHLSDATMLSTDTTEQGMHSSVQAHPVYDQTSSQVHGSVYYPVHTAPLYNSNVVEASTTIAPTLIQPGGINKSSYPTADEYPPPPNDYPVPHMVAYPTFSTLPGSLAEPKLSSGHIMVEDPASGPQKALTRRAMSKKLKKAIKRTKVKKLRQCTDCNGWFDSKRSNWDRHANTHSGKKCFKCTSCGRERVTKDQIIVHYIRRHLGVPYDCKPLPEQRAEAKKHVAQIS